MGLYIPDKNRPRSCEECRKTYLEIPNCPVMNKMISSWGIAIGCPLVEVDDITFRTFKAEKGETMNKDKMEALIEDINPKEIASHVGTDTLSEWCEILRHKMIYTLNRMRNSLILLHGGTIVEPKTGHWVEVNSYESEHHSVTDMRCNICGKYSSVVLPHKTRFTYPYCPYCGAKMERGNDE